MDDANIHDNQSESGAVHTQDITSFVDFESLEMDHTMSCMSDALKTSKSVVPPQSIMKKCQKRNNRSKVKKHQKTSNKSKASTVDSVNSTATNDNVPQSITRLPAALTAHSGWKIIGAAALEKLIFTSKSALLDNFLSIIINAYVTDVQQQLCSKLANVRFEVNELNLFPSLLSSGLEYIIEYLTESLTRMGFNKTSTHELHRFRGTLMLLSSFNLSTEQTWELMEKINNNKVISNKPFIELIKNLRGFEVNMRHGG